MLNHPQTPETLDGVSVGANQPANPATASHCQITPTNAEDCSPSHQVSAKGNNSAPQSIPADLTRLAHLWPKIPAAVRDGWLVTAEALARNHAGTRTRVATPLPNSTLKPAFATCIGKRADLGEGHAVSALVAAGFPVHTRYPSGSISCLFMRRYSVPRGISASRAARDASPVCWRSRAIRYSRSKAARCSAR